MNKNDFISELSKVFAQNKLSSYLNTEKSDKFYELTIRMLEENEKYNLTAITEPRKIILNHYADCALLARYLPSGAKIIDVGCGAGFPTLPLAIVRDDISVLAIDSTAKRVKYVEETANMLGLSNVKTMTLRAEDGAKKPELREQFDYATARAVAEMRVLLELCLPYVKVGGKMLAMKGKNAEFELAGAKRAVAMLGGTNAKVEHISLTGIDEVLTHPIITVDKKAKTPPIYPRPYAQISKKQL